jgi:alpha-tubulin suppressor-like RCC1 family protein
VAVVDVGGAGLLDEVTVLSAGGSHTCARRVEGGVLCWGDNFTGQLGDGQTHQACTPGDCSPVPVPVAAVGGQGALGDIVDLTAGASGSCAIRGDGTAVCWGQGEVGQLGEVATHPTCSTMVGPIECSPVPVVVSDIGGAGSLQAVTALDSGLSHTCAIHGAGSLVCWGVNEGGELGDGLTHQACAEELGGPLDCSYSPVPTAPLP